MIGDARAVEEGKRLLLAGSKLSGTVPEKFSSDSGRPREVRGKPESNSSRLRINYHDPW